MITTRVFKSGNSQAIRIPKEMRTDKKTYLINKIGDIYVAYPADDPWAPVREALDSFPKDIELDRNQPSWDDVSPREEF